MGWSCIPLAVQTYGNGGEAQSVSSRLASLLTISQASPKAKMVAEIYGHINLFLVAWLAIRAILGRELVHGYRGELFIG